MTEIEIQFLRHFGIEPYKFDGVYYHHIEYPQITSDILLELICICSSYLQSLDYDICPNLFEIGAKNMNDLKEEILESCILYSSKENIIGEQVKALFKAEEEQND